MSSQFVIRAPEYIIQSMNAPLGQPSLAKLATAYGVSRQRLHQVSKNYGRSILLNPDKLAARMLPKVFQSPTPSALIDSLRDPGERKRIKASISQLTTT